MLIRVHTDEGVSGISEVKKIATYAGGLNILAEPFEPLFGTDGLRVWMLGHEGLYPMATRLLKED